MSNLILETQGIDKTFFKSGSSIPVLRGVNFQMAEGEMVAITGPSGAGKSTFLHVLGTLEPPTNGKVFFGPERYDVFAFNEKSLSQFRNRSLGFVFQFHYLLPEFTALENVTLPALIAGHSKRSAETHAKELLDFVGMGHRLSHRPPELSGGEQQRVAIARAVILRPKLLLADELTGNLDTANSENVMDLLIQLNRSIGISILLVTHDQNLAGRMHRQIEMRDGRIT